MENIISNVFALLGVGSLILLTYIDRKYPGEDPIDNLVYWIIGAYVVIVLGGPKNFKLIVDGIINRLFSLKIIEKKDDK